MTAFNHYQVALIDSGIGGFSVLAEIERQLPGIGVRYFMDNRYLPYGELQEQILLGRLESIVEFLLTESRPDLIVIACNTAATQSLAFLRERFDSVFVGVVPAVKPAAKMSASRRIGVLATPATVKGDYMQGLINQFAAECEVYKVGSSDLVHLAEQHFWQEGDEDTATINLQSLDDVDTVVLGCTHFPLIKKSIESMLPEGVALVDSGSAIAKRVESLLFAGKKECSEKKAPVEKEILSGQIDVHNIDNKQLYASGDLSQHRQEILTNMGFDKISVVTI